MEERDVETFVAAARIAGDLVTRPEVGERWDSESACARMTVGGLAHHLVRQVSNTVALLGEPPTDEEPIPLLEHYRRAAWVRAAPDDAVNVGIREDSDTDAAGGPEALAPVVAETLAALPGVLRAPRVPDVVHIPWQGWSLSGHDWVVTRLMELVVHADDLAASLEVPTPEFPTGVVTPVLALLSGVAVQRHGQVAVIRALSRPQRSSGPVSAF